MVVKRVKQKQISFGYCDTVSGERVYPPRKETTEMAEADLLPEQMPPEQAAAFTPDSDDEMNDVYVNTTVWPPLAQATTIAKDQDGVTFTVLVEHSSSSTLIDGKSLKVNIWHNHGGEHDWAELPLEPSSSSDRAFLLHRPKEQTLSRSWFTGHLPGDPKHGQAVSFTVKYQLHDDLDWKWIKDVTGLSDGQLVYETTHFEKHSTYDFKHWFSGVSADVKVQSEKPDTDNTFLYSLTAPVVPAFKEDSGYQHHQLGQVNHNARWFGLVRLWSPWLAPRQGKDKFEVDKDAVELSFLREDGLHVVVLGISGVADVVTTFINDHNGNIIIKARNDRTETQTSQVLVAVADNFEVANAAVWYHARKIVQAYGVAGDENADIKKLMETIQPDDNPNPEWLEEWYDGFTFCTWNALGQKLTAQKIHDALDDLAKENINITNLIIDDNWQSLSEGDSQFTKGWSAFEANKEGFPDGMKKTTAEIRRRHPNIKHIAVWHAILGYWGGIDPEGKIAQNYKTIEVEKEPGVAGGKFTVVAAEDAKRMYDDFYSFLASAGVDSVKTDAQFFLDLLLHAPDRRNLIQTYQDAWAVAHLRHLSSRAISCMSQNPQNLFHSQLPTNKPRLLVRNSDDFFPEVDASHPWHIFCNAHNSLLTQHLNVLPDWDMFQTSHEWAGFHAAARTVSGGPIYFTDYPGKHDITLIKQMTAQTPRDKTVILRPQVIGKSLNPYNQYSDLALLKIGTYHGFAQTGTGILGLFNVSGQHLSEFVKLDEFPGTDSAAKDAEYVVGEFTSGLFSQPIKLSDSASDLVGVELQTQGWEILTSYALRSFTLSSSTTPVKVALLGLIEKMTGSAAVTGYDVYVEDNGRLRFWVSLKALGVLGIWISDLAERNVDEGFIVLIYGKPIPRNCVKKSEKDERVLQIDVERAWRESGEDVGWGNEVSLEVFMK
ncbi:Putative glycosyl hydrolase 36, aldolase-type TIM barrel, glycoside hydrolase superfamily [Septoria linicola]|uniref:Glycosyl hydrolase 36, aldolase-type TIM barrel, glycoside hydrolase superfamily n=1 Tax=Septoria linicola TaxID=215465 RepID=A0A9Q9ALA6_9PEZI|nr:putative glycosyl hydrolase 36, aldolase-type TIM barrel, glycoside hydrolase superfamily [Septoria linicola]USW48535.1 Putative glycosyl hydrolase 36, aldolase-type TIM barrel, glycoside hydrolase superfamily [Septoria linicola]